MSGVEIPMKRSYSLPSGGEVVQHDPLLNNPYDDNRLQVRPHSSILPRTYGMNGTPIDFDEPMEEETPLVGKANSGKYGSMQDPSQNKADKEEVETCKPLSPLRRTKAIILFILVVTFTVLYAVYPDQNLQWIQFSVSDFQSDVYPINNTLKDPILKIYLLAKTLSYAATNHTNNLIIEVNNTATNESQTAAVVVPNPYSYEYDRVDPSETSYTFKFDDQRMGDFVVTMKLHANNPFSVPGSFSAQPMSIKIENSVIYGICILVGVYLLIIFEWVHRTVAAVLGALAGIAVMAGLNQKPSMEEMLMWIDYDTLALLFGMMVIVAIICETGIFDWCALQAYKIAKGKTWPLITTLCVFAAVVSAFLDNVTTILLLTPVTIRLCEVLDIDPKHVMIAEVIFSNIGGTATGIGDPPNVIILSNSDIQALGIDFGTFTIHMAGGAILCAFFAYGLLRLMYRRKELLRSEDPPEVAELLREIEIWKRTCKSMVIASREENTVKALLLQKVATLENLLQRKRFDLKNAQRGWKIQVEELAKIYYIRDYVLVVKCGLVLSVVIICFFLESFLDGMYLTLGWIPIYGSVWLLILTDFKDLDSILHRIEWATLIFFAALFIMMESLQRLGVITFITNEVTEMIMAIPEESRLAVAIIIILWISALCSSFIDNIPYTTAMIPVIVNISGDPDVDLPLEPLLYALAFGACLGGNGTLVGASANVVCAGIAETHGHKFSFMDFFKAGFPMMLLTTTVAMCYLLLCHVAFDWGNLVGFPMMLLTTAVTMLYLLLCHVLLDWGNI